MSSSVEVCSSVDTSSITSANSDLNWTKAISRRRNGSRLNGTGKAVEPNRNGGEELTTSDKWKPSNEGVLFFRVDTKPQSQKFQMFKIRSTKVARLIGHYGSTVEAFRNASGAEIDVETRSQSPGDLYHRVFISGTPSAIQRAVAMIEALITDNGRSVMEVIRRALLALESEPSTITAARVSASRSSKQPSVQESQTIPPKSTKNQEKPFGGRENSLSSEVLRKCSKIPEKPSMDSSLLAQRNSSKPRKKWFGKAVTLEGNSAEVLLERSVTLVTENRVVASGDGICEARERLDAVIERGSSAASTCSGTLEEDLSLKAAEDRPMLTNLSLGDAALVVDKRSPSGGSSRASIERVISSHATVEEGSVATTPTAVGESGNNVSAGIRSAVDEMKSVNAIGSERKQKQLSTGTTSVRRLQTTTRGAESDLLVASMPTLSSIDAEKKAEVAPVDTLGRMVSGSFPHSSGFGTSLPEISMREQESELVGVDNPWDSLFEFSLPRSAQRHRYRASSSVLHSFDFQPVSASGDSSTAVNNNARWRAAAEKKPTNPNDCPDFTEIERLCDEKEMTVGVDAGRWNKVNNDESLLTNALAGSGRASGLLCSQGHVPEAPAHSADHFPPSVAATARVNDSGFHVQHRSTLLDEFSKLRLQMKPGIVVGSSSVNGGESGSRLTTRSDRMMGRCSEMADDCGAYACDRERFGAAIGRYADASVRVHSRQNLGVLSNGAPYGAAAASVGRSANFVPGYEQNVWTNQVMDVRNPSEECVCAVYSPAGGIPRSSFGVSHAEVLQQPQVETHEDWKHWHALQQDGQQQQLQQEQQESMLSFHDVGGARFSSVEHELRPVVASPAAHLHSDGVCCCGRAFASRDSANIAAVRRGSSLNDASQIAPAYYGSGPMGLNSAFGPVSNRFSQAVPSSSLFNTPSWEMTQAQTGFDAVASEGDQSNVPAFLPFPGSFPHGYRT